MRSRQCGAHKHTQLVPIEVHHIWPLGYHGPDIPSNKVAICANAHSDTHYMLEALLRGKHVDGREYGIGVRRLALRGFHEVMAYGETLSERLEAHATTSSPEEAPWPEAESPLFSEPPS